MISPALPIDAEEPPLAGVAPAGDEPIHDSVLAHWLRALPNWGRNIFRNGRDILRVIDILKLRPLPAGLVSLDHPWVTGISPETGRLIWPDNVIYRSPQDPGRDELADDETVLLANGRFLAGRVRQSAELPELPIGPARRMPHCINYIHGSSHYNSGVILLNDLADGFRHVNDPQFRAEIRRFVRAERREVLFLFRTRTYDPREYAFLSCCMRSQFPWFCNPNGPGDRVLWGNAAPFPAANLITSHWADDVYALKSPGGADRVIRPPIRAGEYFPAAAYGRGTSEPRLPEKLLAWGTYWRIKIRGQRGGMFFIDRRKSYADQIDNRRTRGLSGESRARF